MKRRHTPMQIIYRYKVFDIINGVFAFSERRATADFIKKAHGEIVGSGHDVDDELLTPEGQVIQEFTSEEGDLIRELYKRGTAQISGNMDHRPLKRMVLNQLVTSRAIALDCVEYEITERGRKAVEQLL
jgi:hypothetical protein